MFVPKKMLAVLAAALLGLSVAVTALAVSRQRDNSGTTYVDCSKSQGLYSRRANGCDDSLYRQP